MSTKKETPKRILKLDDKPSGKTGVQRVTFNLIEDNS